MVTRYLSNVIVDQHVDQQRNTFRGNLISSCKCSCGATKSENNTTPELLIHKPLRHNDSLQDLVTRAVVETSRTERKKCTKCDAETVHTCSAKYAVAPAQTLLAVRIARSLDNASHPCELSNIETLTLPHPSPATFRLTGGFLDHGDRPGQGPYASFRVTDHGTWLYTMNEKCFEVDLSTICTAMPYVMFYVRDTT